MTFVEGVITALRSYIHSKYVQDATIDGLHMIIGVWSSLYNISIMGENDGKENMYVEMINKESYFEEMK